MNYFFLILAVDKIKRNFMVFCPICIFLCFPLVVPNLNIGRYNKL